MKLRTIRYFFKEASTSIARNRILSVATAATISVCVFVLGIALLLFINSGEIIDKLESDVEIVAYLDNNLSPYARDDLEERLLRQPEVKSVEYVSKDEALSRLDSRLGQGEYKLSDTLGGANPLPDSLKIKASTPRQVGALAAKIKDYPGIVKIRYAQDLVKKLFSVTRWVRAISLFIVLFLAFAAVFLVATTIRLTIFSRRKEIYIMKLVGATNWFIRMPFFLEGIFLAAVGTVFAVTILYFGYYYLLNSMQTAMFFVPLVTNQQTLVNTYLVLLGMGIGIGIIGTFISVNKYLDV